MEEKEQRRHLDASLKFIVRSSFIVFIGIFLSKGLAYLHRIIIARYYGPEMYGLYLLAFTILIWCGSISSLGLSDGVLRYVSIFRGKNDKDKIRYTVRLSTLLVFSLGLLIGIILFLTAPIIATKAFHNSGLEPFLRIFSILVPVGVCGNILLSTIRAYEQIGWYSFIFNILQNFVKVGALILIILLSSDINGIIFSQVLATTAVLVASYWVVKKYLPNVLSKPKISVKTRTKLRAEIISYSWPIVFYGIISVIFYNIDSFTIGYFLGAEEVGIYNVAVPIALLLGFAPELFMQLFFPLISREYAKKNRNTINDLSKQVSKWIFMINIPIFIAILLFPNVIINLLFGGEYLSAANSLRILSFGALFSSMGIVSQNLVSIAGKSRWILVNTVVISTLNVVLNLILIPVYGIEGAAIATTICFIILSITLYTEAWSILKVIPLRRAIIKILLISIVPISALLLIEHFFISTLVTLIIAGIIYALLYGGLILLTNVLDQNDKMVLQSLLKKVMTTIRKSKK